jgi:hypothetical protein
MNLNARIALYIRQSLEYVNVIMRLTIRYVPI